MDQIVRNIDREYQLGDRYTKRRGQVFITGTQALVRIPLMQAELDRENGLNTAGFISGYRGSPLGNYDRELWRAERELNNGNIKFEPGINEELAATAVMGSQQVETSGFGDYGGVFAIWYGKGPGVDRAGDALKHANAFGSSPHGGVLVIAGDDHGAASSSMNHQSEQALASWMMPVLAPATLQDYLEFGLYGIALSRYSGCWSGFIAVSEVVESAATVNLDNINRKFVAPPHKGYDPAALHYRWPDPFKEIEGRLINHKLKAVHAFARANPIDKIIWDAPAPKLGLISCSKGHLDLMQALSNAGIDRNMGEKLGISILKIGLSWPLEPENLTTFTGKFDRIIVIEEKRGFVEGQIREILYNLPKRPEIIGKNNPAGEQFLDPVGEISPEDVLKALTPYLKELGFKGKLDALNEVAQTQNDLALTLSQKDKRTPYFCSGCPHNSSTLVPEGSRAMAGIGCHFLATSMNRNTSYLVPMGGEGANWLGQSPFTHEKHIFQNMGDGTYYHSGLLAIRQSVAAKVNITYKILYNDAIAMTGGQPLEGTLRVDQISWQLHHEGVTPIRVVTDEPEKYDGVANFAPGVTIHHRLELDRVQRELRDCKGVSGLIYDQTCASEKRKRRKKNEFPDPPKRAFINDLVCEGCGDCSVQSNCLSILPLETELGRKRAIDQSSCNKDYSCINGFCPSFVSVHGGKVKKGTAQTPDDYLKYLTEPVFRKWGGTYDIMVTGIGGTGVVTIGQIIAMAAHLEGRGASSLDFTGFAQKGGAVISYIRLAQNADSLKAVRIGTGTAHLMIGCDMVVAGSPEALRTMGKGVTQVILNSRKNQTAQFIHNRDADVHKSLVEDNILKMVGQEALDRIDATHTATRLMGDSIATNMFLLGYAWQKGQVPLSRAAIFRAIELNNVAIEGNKQSFIWGRIAANGADLVEKPAQTLTSLDDIITFRADYLADYQDEKLKQKYLGALEKLRKICSDDRMIEAAARNYFKLLAIKDEYEVARLYTDGRFIEKIKNQFEGDYKIHFHMAPPLLSRRNDKGHLVKREFGGWMFKALKLTAKMRFLRGSVFDIFGMTCERKMEKRLVRDYENLLEEISSSLCADNFDPALKLLSLPTDIRGFGHVKEVAVRKTDKKAAQLLNDYRDI